MRKSVATALLGLPSDSFPSQSELKVAYRKKAWETHPDRFPPSEKSHAESKFKQVSEAYTCLKTGTISWDTTSGRNANVMRRAVSQKSTPFNSTLVKIPFAIIVFGTVFLGGFNAARKEWSLAGCSTTRLRKDLEHQFPV